MYCCVFVQKELKFKKKYHDFFHFYQSFFGFCIFYVKYFCKLSARMHLFGYKTAKFQCSYEAVSVG